MREMSSIHHPCLSQIDAIVMPLQYNSGIRSSAVDKNRKNAGGISLSIAALHRNPRCWWWYSCTAEFLYEVKAKTAIIPLTRGIKDTMIPLVYYF